MSGVILSHLDPGPFRTSTPTSHPSSVSQKSVKIRFVKSATPTRTWRWTRNEHNSGSVSKLDIFGFDDKNPGRWPQPPCFQDFHFSFLRGFNGIHKPCHTMAESQTWKLISSYQHGPNLPEQQRCQEQKIVHILDFSAGPKQQRNRCWIERYCV